MSLSLSKELEQEVPSSIKESLTFLFFMMLALKEQITRAKDHSKRKKKKRPTWAGNRSYSLWLMSKKIKSKLEPELTLNSNSIWQLKPKPKLTPSTQSKQHCAPGKELKARLSDGSLCQGHRDKRAKAYHHVLCHKGPRVKGLQVTGPMTGVESILSPVRKVWP